MGGIVIEIQSPATRREVNAFLAGKCHEEIPTLFQGPCHCSQRFLRMKAMLDIVRADYGIELMTNGLNGGRKLVGRYEYIIVRIEAKALILFIIGDVDSRVVNIGPL